NVVLSDTVGQLKGTGLQARATASQTVSPDYYKDVVATGRPAVSAMTKGIVSGRPTIVLAYPLRDRAHLILALLPIGRHLPPLQTLSHSSPLPQGSVITLTDSVGRVLARSRDADRFIGTIVASPPPQSPRDVPPARTLTGLDGVQRFYGNAVVERGPWL